MFCWPFKTIWISFRPKNNIESDETIYITNAQKFQKNRISISLITKKITFKAFVISIHRMKDVTT